jgi:hypothetical protein
VADQTSIKLPDGTIGLGSWTVVGAGGVAHTALSDGLDTTYVQTSARCMLVSQKLRLSIADWTTGDIPTGSKIKSVRAVAKCGTVTTTNRPRFVLSFAQLVFFVILTGNISRILQAIFSWSCPRPPPAAPTTQWVWQELEYKTRDANNEEWTLSSVNAFEVHLSRDDVTGVNGKIGEVTVEVAFNERPVGTATAPTTTQTTTTRPLLTHTYTDDESDPQEAVRWLIYNDTQYGAGGFDPSLNELDDPISKPYWDSGWVFGEDLAVAVAQDLVNDDYRGYVVVRQKWDGIGTHTSVPTFVSWTQNVPGPPAPVITATAEDSLWRIRLDVGKGGTSPVTETYDIYCSDNAGVDWDLVRDGYQVIAVGGDTAQLWDWEAPLNVARWYKVQAFRTLGSIKIGGDFSTVVMATPRSKEFLLKDPLVPALNMALPVGYKGDSPVRKRLQSFHKPLTKTGEAAYAVATIGRRYGVESTLVMPFLVDGDAAWDAFNALYEGGRVLLYQMPTGKQYYIHFDGEPELVDWDIDFRLGETDEPAEVMYRIYSCDYQQVRRP